VTTVNDLDYQSKRKENSLQIIKDVDKCKTTPLGEIKRGGYEFNETGSRNIRLYKESHEK